MNEEEFYARMDASGIPCYDREGKPIPYSRYFQLFFLDPARGASQSYSSVAATKIDDEQWVSTVWLGIDHSFGGPVPQIFETMIFPSNLCVRTSTEAEALAAHEEAVFFVRSGMLEFDESTLDTGGRNDDHAPGEVDAPCDRP